MGWGLVINEIYLSRVTRNELDERIEDEKDTIQDLRDRLMILAAATPRDIKILEGPPGGFGSSLETWEDHVKREINGILKDLADANWQLRLMEIAKDNPEDVVEDI